MMKMVTASLVNGCRAADLLIEQYGPDEVRQVEQLSEHIFRAWLKGGRVAVAIVTDEGGLEIRELEEAC